MSYVTVTTGSPNKERLGDHVIAFVCLHFRQILFLFKMPIKIIKCTAIRALQRFAVDSASSLHQTWHQHSPDTRYLSRVTGPSNPSILESQSATDGNFDKKPTTQLHRCAMYSYVMLVSALCLPWCLWNAQSSYCTWDLL